MCLRALGETGTGTPSRIYSLEAWLGDCIRVSAKAGAKAKCRSRDDGGANITVPLEPDDWKDALTRGEEMGHYLALGGCQLPPPPNPLKAAPEEINLDEVRELYEEAEARAFLEALMIPDQALLKVKCEADLFDLMDDCRLGAEAVQRRWLHFQEHGPERFFGPEPWSAWQKYRAELIPSRVASKIRILPRNGTGLVLEWPVENAQEGEVKRLQLYRDLAALRPLEFELRCAAEQPGRGVDLDYNWQEFEALCARRSVRGWHRARIFRAE